MNHILVVQTAFLGDLMLSIPLFKRLRVLWPQCRISLVCRSGLGRFFLETHLVDQIFEVKKGQASSYRMAEKSIESLPVDLVVAPHTSLRTTLFCLQLRAQHKVSFRKPWNKLIFTQRLSWPGQLPEALRQLFLLTPWDADLAKQFQNLQNAEFFYQKNPGNRLSAIPDWASMSCRSLLQKSEYQKNFLSLPASVQSAAQSGRAVLLFPGSVWATKKWTADGFLQVAESLLQKNWQVIWMGGPGEEALAADLGRRSPGSLVLAGKTSVLQSCLLMLRSSLVICNDSAASHLAALTDTPVLTIFGPTVLSFGYRPWTSVASVIEKEGLSCRPCGRHGGKTCPIKTHECMTHISAQEVETQALALLARN